MDSSGQQETVFSARGVTRVYDMGEVQVHALRGIDLELYRGEFVVMLGASGCRSEVGSRLISTWGMASLPSRLSTVGSVFSAVSEGLAAIASATLSGASTSRSGSGVASSAEIASIVRINCPTLIS